MPQTTPSFIKDTELSAKAIRELRLAEILTVKSLKEFQKVELRSLGISDTSIEEIDKLFNLVET